MSLEVDWEEILNSIYEQKCTPFIGAGACSDWIPLASEVSSQMAAKYEYPLDDIKELDRVSQYVAIVKNDMVPKTYIVRWLKEIKPPDFSKLKYRDTPHAVLADLNLPLYITTNYDEFMEQAIRCRGKTVPDSEFCRWNTFLKLKTNIPSVLTKEYKLDKDRPLVYHLHGYIKFDQSLVLTETDYLEFLINLTKKEEEEFFPYQINTALYSTSLLFIGYSLRDVNFRFIFRGLAHYLQTAIGTGSNLPSIAVQLPSGFTKEKKNQALEYLNKYNERMFMYIFIGRSSF